MPFLCFGCFVFPPLSRLLAARGRAGRSCPVFHTVSPIPSRDQPEGSARSRSRPDHRHLRHHCARDRAKSRSRGVKTGDEKAQAAREQKVCVQAPAPAPARAPGAPRDRSPLARAEAGEADERRANVCVLRGLTNALSLAGRPLWAALVVCGRGTHHAERAHMHMQCPDAPCRCRGEEDDRKR